MLVRNATNKSATATATAEYIPVSTIPTLLHTAFPHHTILHEYSTTHFVIKAPIADFLQAPIQNWEYNRPPDLTRCTDIAYYYTTKPMETMFYLAFNHRKNHFDVLDGIHRYTALKMIGAAPALIEPVLLNIRFNATDLVEVFKSLNKANPVPELYVRDTAKDKRDAIQTLAATWKRNYSAHFSASLKPNKPNVNYDRFVDFLDAIWEKHGLTEETKGQLEQLVNAANEEMRREPPQNLTPAVMEKCTATGCWLFVMRLYELEGIV